MDLGNLIGTIVGGAVDVAKAKYVQQPQYVSYPSTGVDPGYRFTGAIPAQPAFNMPFVDVIPETGETCGKKMNWNPRLNKWVPARRRRRRRLATTSDIKDIAALKAVLGPTQLKTWIATHS